MGVLSDLFAATEAELTKLATENAPSAQFQTVEGNGFAPEQFAKLLSAIEPDISSADAVVKPYFQCVLLAKEGGPWVYQMPPRIVSGLGSADAAQLLRVRSAWQGKDEKKMLADDPLVGVIPDWLDETAALCRNAVNNGRNVYLWICL